MICPRCDGTGIIYRGDSMDMDLYMMIFGCVCVIAIAYIATHTTE